MPEKYASFPRSADHVRKIADTRGGNHEGRDSMKKRLQQFATECNTLARELTAKQQKAAMLLASGQADEIIADELGVDRSTIFRWRQSPTFRAEVNKHREAMLAMLQDSLRDAVSGALDTLKQIMTKSVDDSLKLKAASVLLGTVPWHLRSGPTDPRELVRSEAQQRFEDEPRQGGSLDLLLDGRKPVNEHVTEVLDELDKNLD